MQKRKLPNAKKAIIESTKICDYILSVNHPAGRFKARFFMAFGYSSKNWKKFKYDILKLAVTGQVTKTESNEYGIKYEVQGNLSAPNGESVSVTTVWIILNDDDTPRLITAYPGGL